MTLTVAILAGGMGTRLGELAGSVPKALVDVAGKPFVCHQLELLRRNGLRRAVLCVAHRGEMIRDALGDGSRFGMELDYVFDGPALLGTGGALKRALPVLGEAFFVLYGDAYLDCDYAAVERKFRKSGKQGLMTVYRNAGRWDRSNVVFRDGRIVRYDKRNATADMEHIDYGLGVFRAEAFAGYPPGTPFDLEAVQKDLLSRNELAAFEVSRRFYEIGSPGGLEETRRHLAGKDRTP